MFRYFLLLLFFGALLFTTAGKSPTPSPSPSPSDSSKDASKSSEDTSTQSGSRQETETSLKLLGRPIVFIDASNGGTAQLELTAGADGPYSIRCQNFKSSATQQFLNAGVTFSESSSPTTGFTAKKDLKKNELWVLKVEVSNFLEAGEATANLVDGAGRTLGGLTAVRLHVPFGVKLETSNPENAELVITRGRTSTITLHNDDAYSYPVLYHLSIDDVSSREGRIELSANGSQSTNFDPPAAWFSGPLQGMFKSQERSGRLTLSYDSANLSQKSYLPTKSLPVTLRLNYWSDWVPQILGTLILLALLTLGGVSSLLVSCGIPNKQRQVQMREQVLSLARRTSAVSPSVDSRLRVLMRMERKKLDDQLLTKRVWGKQLIADPILLIPEWALPDFADTLAAVAVGVTKLEIRVDLSEELDRLRHALEGVSDQLPPTIIDQVNSNLQETADRARKPQLAVEEITLAKSLLAKAEALMTGWAQDTAFATAISSRLKRVRGLLGVDDQTANPNLLKNTEVFNRFRNSMPNTFLILDDQKLLDPANITPEEYKYLDTATAKLELAVEYIRFFQGLSADRQPELAPREKLLRDALAKDSWQSLKCAQTFVREVKSGVYPEALRAELLVPQGANGQAQVSIELDRQQARQTEPLELCVDFHNRALRRVPALDEWTPLWEFKPRVPGGLELREKWWTVWHYFDGAGDYEVQVHFEGADGKPITDDNGSTLSVSKTIQVLPKRQADKRDRLRGEILKLGIVLFVALVALIGGARDQIAKLDLVQGLLAVFVMGFGANVVKDLVTKTSSSAKESP